MKFALVSLQSFLPEKADKSAAHPNCQYVFSLPLGCRPLLLTAYTSFCSFRSLLAAEVLYNAGYRNLAWLEGGFRFVENKDLPEMVGDSKIKYASAGGIAGVLLTTVDKFQSS